MKKVVIYAFAFTLPMLVQAQKLPKLGFAASLQYDSVLYRSGFKLIGESVSRMLAPSLSEQQFSKIRADIRKAQCKVYMCNVFFPASLKIAGPDVNQKRVLVYADSVFMRAKQAGIPFIVLGSGGARRLPDGYDRVKANIDFIALASKMARSARRHGIMIVIENLNSTETNFINTVKEATAVVAAVNHPNFRLNADIYHMMKEGEPASELLHAGKWIRYAEVAEKETRTLPGTNKDDFRPYFKALKQIRYKGIIGVEGRWNDLAIEAPLSYQYLHRQLTESYR